LRDVEVFAGRQCAHLQTVLLTNCLRRVALTTFDSWRETFGDAELMGWMPPSRGIYDA
jgi:hypothetical protein